MSEAMFGIRHYVDIYERPRDLSKTKGEYRPRYKAMCGEYVMAGAGTFTFTEITCDECLEKILQFVLNNLVMVESGNYEAIEAGWAFVRAREARELAEASGSTKSRKKSKKKR